MSREILFRGKSIEVGEWVYGSLDLSEQTGFTHVIITHDKHKPWNKKAVITETVGQFTGLLDKNGVMIFEGDTVKTPKGISKVTYQRGCFYVITCSKYRLGGWNTDSIEVINN